MVFLCFSLSQAKACYNPRDGALVGWCANLIWKNELSEPTGKYLGSTAKRYDSSIEFIEFG